MDLNLELARLKELEQLINVELELLACLDIPKQRRTSNLDALGRQFSKIISINSKTSTVKESTYGKGSGGTGPLAFPNQTIMPFLLTASKLPSQVSFPTES